MKLLTVLYVLLVTLVLSISTITLNYISSLAFIIGLIWIVVSQYWLINSVKKHSVGLKPFYFFLIPLIIYSCLKLLSAIFSLIDETSLDAAFSSFRYIIYDLFRYGFSLLIIYGVLFFEIKLLKSSFFKESEPPLY